jgi:thiamine biosynthesis lipoprotein
VGGNVRAIGGKDEDNTPWRVGIQDPEIPNRAANLHILDLVEKSLVTSGNYSRYYVVNGKRYHHIINPDTLFPAEYFDSLTIICVDSGRADALSTAIYNMPFDQGLKLIESLQETEAFWIFPDGTQKQSSNFFSD